MMFFCVIFAAVLHYGFAAVMYATNMGNVMEPATAYDGDYGGGNADVGFYNPNNQGAEGVEGGEGSQGIAGVAGVDYPTFSAIPQTGFSCSQPGYYADQETRCQAFHICQADGKHEAFLCPNGSIFNQEYFVCDWWYNVDCSQASNFYGRNSDLFRVASMANAGFGSGYGEPSQSGYGNLANPAPYGGPMGGYEDPMASQDPSKIKY